MADRFLSRPSCDYWTLVSLVSSCLGGSGNRIIYGGQRGNVSNDVDFAIRLNQTLIVAVIRSSRLLSSLLFHLVLIYCIKYFPNQKEKRSRCFEVEEAWLKNMKGKRRTSNVVLIENSQEYLKLR